MGEIDVFHINFGDIREPWGPIGQSFQKANPMQTGEPDEEQGCGEAM